VTGASGFFGAWVVRALAARGAAVWPWIGPQRPAWRLAGAACEPPERVELCAGADALAQRLAARRPSCVVHCAAAGVAPADTDPVRLRRVNVDASLALLEAAARSGAQRFVQLGSGFEYGSSAQPLAEDAPLRPESAYAASKAAASALVSRRAPGLGIEALVLRPFGLWGPGEAAHRLAAQIERACRERTPLALTACEGVRDLSFAPDAAHWLAALVLGAPAAEPGTYNLGSGRACSLREFASALARELGGEELLRFGALPYRPGTPARLVADVRKLDARLPGRSHTPLREAAARLREFPREPAGSAGAEEIRHAAAPAR
jgi:nucleoside-diphosphate-sugar epimerase